MLKKYVPFCASYYTSVFVSSCDDMGRGQSDIMVSNLTAFIAVG